MLNYLGKINTIVFFSNSGPDAMAVIRLLGPAQQLGLRVVNGCLNGKVQIDAVNEGDIVVIQRDFSQDLNSYEKILNLAHYQNKLVILDLDDLLFELPQNHPDRLRNYYTNSLLPMIQTLMEVDLVTVATSALKDYLLPFNNNIVVIPNYLNDSLWNFSQPVSSKSANEKISIGYMGGHSHKPDLLMILPVLKRIYDKYPQRIQYKFWGIEPPFELEKASIVDWFPPKSLEYSDFVAYFQTQTADIMVAPLCDSLFNSCKSPIKYLEYSAFGAPGVYSNITPYSKMIDDGKNGFLATSLDEWEASLSRLIEDQELRERIVLEAQENVKKHWLLSQNAEKQLNIYLKAVANKNEIKPSLPPIYPLIKSITRQNYESNQKNNQLIIDNNSSIKELTDHLRESKRQNQILINQLEEKNQQLQISLDQLNLQEEVILSYALSKSWQLTRPFRKIIQLITKG